MAINLSLSLRGNWKYKYIHKALSPQYLNRLEERISLLNVTQVCLKILASSAAIQSPSDQDMIAYIMTLLYVLSFKG